MSKFWLSVCHKFDSEKNSIPRKEEYREFTKDMLPWKENDEVPIEDLLHGCFFYLKLDQDMLLWLTLHSKPIKDLLLWHILHLKLGGDLLHRYSWIGILAGFFVSFGSWMRIPVGFFVSFVSRMGIPGKFFISFGSRILILDRFFVSFCSWMGIPGRSFIPFGFWIRFPARFLILRARPKADLYKDRLIFYRDSAALHEFGHVVASRNSSSFLSLMKEKKQKKIKEMIAISFCLVHVIHG